MSGPSLSLHFILIDVSSINAIIQRSQRGLGWPVDWSRRRSLRGILYTPDLTKMWMIIDYKAVGIHQIGLEPMLRLVVQLEHIK
jgi:hypothetical protein